MYTAQQNQSAFTYWTQDAPMVAGLTNGTFGSSQATLCINQGIRIANDNALYIVDLLNNRIVIMEPNSITAVAIIKTGSNSRNLFMYHSIDVFFTQKLYLRPRRIQLSSSKIFINGTDPVTVVGIKGVFETSLNTSTIDLPSYLFVENNENLYVSDMQNNIMICYPSRSSGGMSGVIVAGNGTQGSSTLQLNMPNGIFFNDAGTLCIADSQNH
ncbi:unnamed protein product [Rotaria sp. Silwood2]|nr:unnamed protein product [Rotaria sp. Silwood2]